MDAKGCYLVLYLISLKTVCLKSFDIDTYWCGECKRVLSASLFKSTYAHPIPTGCYRQILTRTKTNIMLYLKILHGCNIRTVHIEKRIYIVA